MRQCAFGPLASNSADFHIARKANRIDRNLQDRKIDACLPNARQIEPGKSRNALPLLHSHRILGAEIQVCVSRLCISVSDDRQSRGKNLTHTELENCEHGAREAEALYRCESQHRVIILVGPGSIDGVFRCWILGYLQTKSMGASRSSLVPEPDFFIPIYQFVTLAVNGGKRTLFT
jgi:hypothetical protein